MQRPKKIHPASEQQIVDFTRVKELVDQGVYYKRLGDYKLAKNLYYRAIQIDPNMRMTYFSLAKVCYLTQEKQEAITNYLRSAHLLIPSLAKSISSDAASANELQQRLQQQPEGLRAKLQQTHIYAPYLLAEADTPIHLAHVVFDFENKPVDSVDQMSYIETYRQVLSGQGGDLDYSIEDSVYWPVGIDFLLNNIKWDEIDSRDVLSVYPAPRPVQVAQLKSVRIANRATVYVMICQDLLKARHTKGNVSDATGVKSQKDQQILDAVNTCLDLYPSPYVDSWGEIQSPTKKSVDEFGASLLSLERVSRGAGKVVERVLSLDYCSRFNWPDELIRYDLSGELRLKVSARKPFFDEASHKHLGVEYIFEVG